MALSDFKVRTAKPAVKQQKLYDGGGLLLLITPAGGKRWIFKYRIDSKEKSLALGTYPDVSLAEERSRRDSAREKLAAGLNPSEAKKADKRAAQLAAANSFEIVAREWFVTTAVGAEYAKVRTRLLAIPSSYAPQIHRCKTVSEVNDLPSASLLRRPKS